MILATVTAGPCYAESVEHVIRFRLANANADLELDRAKHRTRLLPRWSVPRLGRPYRMPHNALRSSNRFRPGLWKRRSTLGSNGSISSHRSSSTSQGLR